MNKRDLLLVPKPKELDIREGELELPDDGFIVLVNEKASELVKAADRLKSSSQRDWQITASTAGDQSENIATLICDPDLNLPEQGYILDISSDGINIKAASSVGVYYGVCTVSQLLAKFSNTLPFLTIKDWPDFPIRGVMIDISRDKVPTMDTLKRLVEKLSSWKINQLQLYTEHTFAYRAHEVVWKQASPMTGEDILALDRFCAQHYMDLVPNQNSFGHMERWLKHPEYNHLAEIPAEMDRTGLPERPSSTLCPTDPGSIELISSLYDELLPHFTSKYFNVGCDETWDLGKGRSKDLCARAGMGRVYSGFIWQIYREVKKRNRTMLMWGDIILHSPDLIGELPKGIIALEWGYESSHPFKEDTQKFKQAGVKFWVCPGTSAWNSIAGRTDNCLENLRSAAVNGYEAGAEGYLNTDWGDNGHLQYLPFSYLGFLYGAAMSWNVNYNDDGTFPQALSLHAFNDSSGTTGKAAYDMGNAYKVSSKNLHNINMSALFRQILHPLSRLTAVDSLTEEDLIQAALVVRKAIDSMKNAQIDSPDADIIKDEFANAAAMLLFACRMGLMRFDLKEGKDISDQKSEALIELEKIIAEHQRLWLARNRPGGLPDSKQRLAVHISELKS